MRYLFGLLCVCTLGVVALSQSVSAQVGGEGTTSQQASAALLLEGQEPLLPQLVLKASYYYYVYPGCPFGARGGKCAEPTAPTAQTPLEEAQASVRRARAGLIVSSVFLAGGVAVIVGGFVAANSVDDLDFGPIVASGTFGGLIVAGATVGMGFSGKRLRDAKQKRKLNEKDSLGSRRVKWDVARSALVF